MEFESSYGGGTIKPAQFLAEKMCERRAAKEGIKLPQRFWILPRWKREYAVQIIHANSLLKIYSIQAILDAIEKQKNTYSLGAKWLDPYIQEAEMKIAVRRQETGDKKEEVKREEPAEKVEARKSFTTKGSLRSKLDE